MKSHGVKALSIVLLALLPVAIYAAAPFRLKRPIKVDRDDKALATAPAVQNTSITYNIFYNTWLRHVSPETIAHDNQPSLNVNAWDEVPDSSWFTNRIGQRAITFDEIVKGIGGPSPGERPWRVRKRSDEGYTPKVEIYDRTNRRYVVKFDPRGARERNSAAERIGTLIMHAAGYNVVHNTIVTVKRQDLVVDEKSYYYDPVGKRQTLTDRHIDDFLMTLDPMPDGSYRGNASLFLDGGIGPFKFTGLRPDDPNDRIPHQMRRELRGLRVIGSWINHVDIKDDQAIDTYNPAGGQNFVKHYLLDFSATLGAYEWPSAPFRVGHEFMFDASTMSKSFFSLGLWKPEWESQPDPSFREIGYFEAELFEPAKWKPSFPNIAFEQMEGGDAYWGARIVTAFPKDLIERIVQDGEFQNRAAAQYVVDVLLKRQKKIGEYWLNRITPVEEPTLSGARLQFRDLAVDRGYATQGSREYRFQVKSLSGRGLTTRQSLHSTDLLIPDLQSLAAQVPEQSADSFGRVPLLKVVIESNLPGNKWALPTEVYIGRETGSPALKVLGWAHAPEKN